MTPRTSGMLGEADDIRRRPQSPTLVLGGAFVVVAIAVRLLMQWRRSSASVEDRRDGRLSESGLGARDEPNGRRSKARAAIRDGRFDEAFAYYRTVEESRLEAEDFFRLGSVLLARDRTVPGWAALEAARRMDRQSAAIREALDGFQTRLALSTGRERIALEEVAAG